MAARPRGVHRPASGSYHDAVLCDLDRRSVLAGAAYALVISGGAGLIQTAVDDAGARGLLFVVVLFGFFVGGFVAARGHLTSAARHGATAAVLAFLVFQGVAAARRLLDGDGVSALGVIFNAFTAAVCGMLGGLLATRSPGPAAVRHRRGRPEGDG